MAETVHVLGEGGAIFEMSLPLPEAIADQITKGVSKLVDADGNPVDGAEQRVAPDHKALKPEWVGWAVYAGGISVDDADAMTKQDLIDKFGDATGPWVAPVAAGDGTEPGAQVDADGNPVDGAEQT